MRILIAHSFYRLEGGENNYVRQQETLLRGKHQVELLAFDNRSLSLSTSTASRMISSRRTLAEVERRISRFRPQVIHLHNAYPYFGPAVHIAAERQSIPLVMTVHNHRLRCPNGLMFTEGEHCQRCVRGNYLNSVFHHCFPTRQQAAAYATSLWIHRFVFRLEEKIDAFITPSNFMANELSSLGVKREKITVIPNFTTVPPASSPTEISRSHGIYVGRLSAEKGVEVLLDALRAAGDPTFLVIGTGPSEQNLKKRAAELGLRRTEFLGQKSFDEVQALLRTSSYAIFPSIWSENAPLAVLEAMMAGTAPIVSDRGGLPELVQGRGFVFASGDVLALTKLVVALVESPSLAASVGARARADAIEEFSAEGHARRLETLYASLIAKAQRGE